MTRFSQIILFLTILIVSAFAQPFTPFYAGELEKDAPIPHFFHQHSLELYGIADYTILNHAKNNAAFSGGVGLQYSYFFHQCIGVGVGVQYIPYRNYAIQELTIQQQVTELDGFPVAEGLAWIDGLFDFQESSILHCIETPLSLFFVTPDWNRVQFRSAISFAYGWNIAEHYYINGTCNRTFYYVDYVHGWPMPTDFPLEYKGVQETNQMHLVGQNSLLKNHLSISIESGVGFHLTDKTWLDLMVWATYGLNDIHRQYNDFFEGVIYNLEYGYDYGEITGTVRPLLSTNQVDALHNAAVGIKLGVRFAFAHQRPAIVPFWEKDRLLGFDQLAQTHISTMPSLPSDNEFDISKETKTDSVLLTVLHLDGPFVDDGTSQSIEIPTIAAQTQHARLETDVIIMFDLAQSEPTSTSQLLLNMLADALLPNLPKQLLIRGHTCDLGTVQSNLELGQRRADRVKELLAGYGIPEDIMNTSSAGQSEPKVPNSCEENRALNRRITLTYIY